MTQNLLYITQYLLFIKYFFNKKKPPIKEVFIKITHFYVLYRTEARGFQDTKQRGLRDEIPIYGGAEQWFGHYANNQIHDMVTEALTWR